MTPSIQSSQCGGRLRSVLEAAHLLAYRLIKLRIVEARQPSLDESSSSSFALTRERREGTGSSIAKGGL